jgi:hypothetical protein
MLPVDDACTCRARVRLLMMSANLKLDQCSLSDEVGPLCIDESVCGTPAMSSDIYLLRPRSSSFSIQMKDISGWEALVPKSDNMLDMINTYPPKMMELNVTGRVSLSSNPITLETCTASVDGVPCASCGKCGENNEGVNVNCGNIRIAEASFENMSYYEYFLPNTSCVALPF